MEDRDPIDPRLKCSPFPRWRAHELLGADPQTRCLQGIGNRAAAPLVEIGLGICTFPWTSHAITRSLVTAPPTRPKLFHITHVNNLASIVRAGELLSDASMIARGGPAMSIGMSTIKQRRLALPVTCHAGDHVGDYVPFYFCPRPVRPINRRSMSDRGGTTSTRSRAMIEVTRGDILKADAEALVNTVNCVGYMGRGIAAQFKRAYPRNFGVYQAACKRHEVRPGRMLIVETGQVTNPRWVVNFPTKRHWRGKSRLEDIDAGLAALVADIRRLGIKSIAVPPLGCGLGGLDWSEVRPRIEHALATLPHVRVLLFEPDGAPDPEDMARSSDVPLMTPGRAVLVALIERYLVGLMEPFVSLLEIHKLMYFMQEAGEPLHLRYSKALYGPYADNLRHVLSRVEGHFLIGYADGGDAPDKRLELVPGASEQAVAFLVGHPETRARFDRVAELVQGFESPFGMELLATVHWVAVHDGVREADRAMDAVYSWNERKRIFEPRQIQLAWDVLGTGGWLNVASP